MKGSTYFSYFLQNIDCGYSFGKAVLTCTHNLCFHKKRIKMFLLKIFIFIFFLKSLYIALVYFRNELDTKSHHRNCELEWSYYNTGFNYFYLNWLTCLLEATSVACFKQITFESCFKYENMHFYFPVSRFSL